MKFWQILAVLNSENSVIDKYFPHLDHIVNGREEVADNVVFLALAESKLQYYVTSHNYLRLMPEAEFLLKQGIKSIEILSVLDAYKKYGGDAITEVIDYGSYNLSK